MSKVIFLDIDGVLCTRRSHLAYGKEGGVWYDWDPLACNVIIRCCEKGVKIVLSSTWRKSVNIEDFYVQRTKYGFESKFFFDGMAGENWKTPIERINLDEVRGREIQAWLEAHAEITDYKILDDDMDMLPHQMKHLIQTDVEEGMASDNIKKLLNWARALKS